MRKIRVLHCVGEYLHRTQNWIYPQIISAPGIDGGVYFERGVNLDEFPLPSSRRFCRGAQLSRLRRSSIRPLRLAGKAFDRLTKAAAATLARARVGYWRPSVLHAHFGMAGWDALPLREALGVPLITSFYGYDAWSEPARNPIWRARLSELFAKGDAFLVEGSAFRCRLLDLGCAPEKVRVQRLGVNTSRLPFRERGALGALKIVMVGRFVEKKGLADGLRACARAVQRGSDLLVTIIGSAAEGDSQGEAIHAELAKLAAEPPLSGRVRFAGFLTHADTHALMNLQDVFLCPSRHASDGDAEGGYPVILAEAMAMGLVCIGSRHCDIPEVIMDGETGFLFDEGDLDGLVDLLVSMTERSEALGSIGRAGRRHIEENFNLPGQLAALARIYRHYAGVGEEIALGA